MVSASTRATMSPRSSGPYPLRFGTTTLWNSTTHVGDGMAVGRPRLACAVSAAIVSVTVWTLLGSRNPPLRGGCVDGSAFVSVAGRTRYRRQVPMDAAEALGCLRADTRGPTPRTRISCGLGRSGLVETHHDHEKCRHR